MSNDNVDVSIIIPVYNEEAILQAAVVELREQMADLGWSHEIILAENGSTDHTVLRIAQLVHRYPDLRTFSSSEPNYGKALRRGILEARGKYVICEEIDLCDTEFHQAAIHLLRNDDADFVVGSKLLAGSEDERPWLRNVASRLYNGMLRTALDFKGTDTHGLKAFNREKTLSVVNSCIIDKDVFASELVIRAHRSGLRVREVPVRVMEKRAPSINLVRRVPTVIRQVGQLAWAIRGKG